MADRVFVFTFKDGLLARLAHDLRLRVEKFEVGRLDDRIWASFDPRSIVVDGFMVDGRCVPTGVDDRVKIVETIQDVILNVARHPNIHFEGHLREREGTAVQVNGDLTLVGVKRPIAFTATHRDGRLRGTVALRPSEFGIPPYKALAGAIRLQDRVLVEFDLDEKVMRPKA